MYLIDSDVLIYFLKNKQESVELLKKIKPNQRNTSIICIGEILEGLSENEIEKFRNFTSLLNIYEVDLKVIVKFAEIRKLLRKQGKLIDNFDLLIAATCLVYDLILITNNLSHFRRIPGLKLFEKD